MMMNAVPQTTLIACGIFQEEVEQVLRERPGPAPEIVWLEVGLHDSVEKMEETLAGTAAGLRAAGAAGVGLLYGLACLPTMKDFAAERGAGVLPARNCLAALAGEERLKELEQNRTLAASVGWVRRMWLGRAGTATGWTADDYRMHFGRYDRIVVLDPGLTPLTDEEILACFDLVQVPLEVEPCDLECFRRKFLALLAAGTEPGGAGGGKND